MAALPTNGETAWPPKHLTYPYSVIADWDSWYRSGESTDDTELRLDDPRKLSDEIRRRRNEPHDLRIPLAAEIAAASADLLFGDPPAATHPNRQEDLDRIIDEAMIWTKMAEAAEQAAALAGTFLRVGWDIDQPVVLDVIHPLDVVPGFTRGRLRFAIVTRVLADLANRDDVWRHLELHTPGRIEHAVYQGTESILGQRRQLDAHSETADLEEIIDLPFQGLAVEWWPNLRPARSLPDDWGRSDIDGAETQLRALNVTWESWLRDIRLGRARIIVPEDFLYRVSTGDRVFVDQEVFTTLDVPPDADMIEQYQFDIRAADHAATAAALTRHAVSAGGYSPQTFGMDIEGTAQSGTALTIRERKTYRTRGRKMRYAKPLVQRLLMKMLAIDLQADPGGPVGVAFPDADEMTAVESATWVTQLRAAEAMSRFIAVKTVHPDWTDAEVMEEVDRIEKDAGTVADPFAVGSTLFGE